jgi:hypothetical protein
MTAAAMDEESRPLGHSHDSDGLMACSPALPANTRTSAKMLTPTRTTNWIPMSTF